MREKKKEKEIKEKGENQRKRELIKKETERKKKWEKGQKEEGDLRHSMKCKANKMAREGSEGGQAEREI